LFPSHDPGWGLAVWNIPPLPPEPGTPPPPMEPIPVIPPRPIPLNYDHELLIPPSPDDVTGHNGFLLYPTHTGIQSVGDGTGFHSITWPLDLDPFNPDAGPVDYTHTWYEYDLTPNGFIVATGFIDTDGDGVADTSLPSGIIPAEFLAGWDPGDEYINQLDIYGEWLFGANGGYFNVGLPTFADPNFHPVIGMGGSPEQSSNSIEWDQNNAFLEYQAHTYDLDQDIIDSIPDPITDPQNLNIPFRIRRKPICSTYSPRYPYYRLYRIWW